MNVVTKSVEATVSAVESDNPHGEFDVILSTDTLDRDGERLYLDEWKTPLPDHITIDSDHDMSVVSTVGSGKPFINDNGQIQVRGTFASTPHAQNVRTLVNEGHIKTVSVAFRVEKNRKDGKVQRELLNAGFVAVPANPDAVVLSSKSVKSEDEVSHEQMIHDAALALGAMCDGAKGIKPVTEEMVAGIRDSFKAVTIMDDETVDPRKVLAGIDAILDQAQALTVDVDRSALPAEVAQALDMLFGVGPAVDELLEAMGIYDPDSSEDDTEETSSEDSAEKSAAAADDKSAAAADDKSAAAADTSAETEAKLQRARALAFLINKTTEL
jgi:HK97 family phage prohead protease